MGGSVHDFGAAAGQIYALLGVKRGTDGSGDADGGVITEEDIELSGIETEVL